MRCQFFQLVPSPTHRVQQLRPKATFSKLPRVHWRVQHRRKSESASCRFRLRSESEVWAQNAEVNIVGGNGVNAMRVDVETTCKDAFVKSSKPSVSASIGGYLTTPVHSAQLRAFACQALNFEDFHVR